MQTGPIRVALGHVIPSGIFDVVNLSNSNRIKIYIVVDRYAKKLSD